MSDDKPATDLTVPKQRPAHLFRPGQSGNPAGRPKGSRSRFSESYIAAMASDFEEHGVSVITRVRNQSPEIYLKIASDLLPRETAAKIDSVGGGMFVGCETNAEVMQALLRELSIDEALEMCDTLREELLRVASEQAQTVASMGDPNGSVNG